jgi:glutamate-1-semialdehyde 2,1-aminomutase
LKEVQKICRKNNIVFIIDETITGFRWHFKGACHKYQIKPDLVIFGKAIANGFSLAVLAGNKKLMSLGSIHTKNAERVFLLSSTHGAEMSSLAAANQTIKLLANGQEIKKIWKHGSEIMNNINSISKKNGMEKNIWLYGLPCSPYLLTNINNQNSFKLKTLLQQELIKNKILMPWISIASCHGDKEVKILTRAFKNIIPKLKKIIDSDINKVKFKNIIKPVFRKYN